MSSDTPATEDTFMRGEFVELEYTARVADDGLVVDTTDPDIAAGAALADVDADGPVVVVLGEGHVFEPVEDALGEMGPGERRTVRVEPEDGFGEVDPTQRHAIPVDALPADSVEQNDRVSVDGRVGYVDAVDDGTATVDFNHPLAGTTLEYDVRAVRRIEGLDERIGALLWLHGLQDDVSWERTDRTVTCTVQRTGPPDEGWSDQKRQFLSAVREFLAVETVRFEERYTTG